MGESFVNYMLRDSNTRECTEAAMIASLILERANNNAGPT